MKKSCFVLLFFVFVCNATAQKLHPNEAHIIGFVLPLVLRYHSKVEILI